MAVGFQRSADVIAFEYLSQLEAQMRQSGTINSSDYETIIEAIGEVGGHGAVTKLIEIRGEFASQNFTNHPVYELLIKAIGRAGRSR